MSEPLNFKVEKLTSSVAEYDFDEDIHLALESDKNTDDWRLVLDDAIPCEEIFEPPPGAILLTDGNPPPQPPGPPPAARDPGAGRPPRAMGLTIVLPQPYWQCPLSKRAVELSGEHCLCFQDPGGRKTACVTAGLRIPDAETADVLVTFPRVFVTATHIRRVRDDPPKAPNSSSREAFKALEETEYINSFDNRIPADATVAYNSRLEIVNALSQSSAGTGLLIQYFNGHPASWDVLNRIISVISAFSGLQYDPSFAEFLKTLGTIHHSFESGTLVEALDLDTLQKFHGIWLTWLQEVEPAKLSKIPGPYRTVDDSFVTGACSAFKRSWDPSGIEAAVSILNLASADTGAPTACFQYLARMGDQRLAEIAARRADVCRNPSYVALADDRNFPGVYSSLRCDPPVTLLARSRPDLMRGVARIIFSDAPEASVLIRGNSSWVAPAYQQAGAVFGAEGLLKQALSVEEQKDLNHLAGYIDLLGKLHSSAGNNDLLRWAQREEPDGISVAASRALFRRLIGPGRDSLLPVISRMEPAERGELVFRILAASGLFPNLDFPQRMLEDDVVLTESDVSAYFRRPATYPWKPDLLRKFEPGLLDWIGWTKNPESLSTTYALMKSGEANRRFCVILEGGSETAIHDAWFYGNDVPENLLSSLLSKQELSSSARTYLRMLLSAKGNRQAYESIRDLLSDEQSRANEFFLPFLDEVVRWQDWRFLQDLYLQAESHSAGKDAFYWRARMVEILARFVRERPDLSNTMLGPNVSKQPDPEIIVRALIKAESPNSEIYLRMYESQILKMPDPEGSAKRLWLAALQKTGTAWCKQKISEAGETAFLTVMGDESAEMLNLLQSRNEASDNALRLGAISRALNLAHSDIAKGRITNGSIQQKEFESLQRMLVRFFPQANFGERIWLIFHLGWERITWSDEFIAVAIKDKAGPVRVRALQHLLLHPNLNFKVVIGRIAANDPYPWCRRLAREILLFEPDPLSPDQGVRFDVDF